LFSPVPINPAMGGRGENHACVSPPPLFPASTALCAKRSFGNEGKAKPLFKVQPPFKTGVCFPGHTA
jgi:hypothetical protein